jgi:hypothetical protein
MATLTLHGPPPAAPEASPFASPGRVAAVLTGGCDGYAAGTTGAVIGARDGCLVFAPDAPERVARWAHPRPALLVPRSFVVTVR